MKIEGHGQAKILTQEEIELLFNEGLQTPRDLLKSPERIEALTLIMGLCLLVYTLGQRLLLQNLQLTNSTVKN
jgi:transposase